MCPLRFILIFLSATLAGFFLIKKFNSSSVSIAADSSSSVDDSPPSRSSKVKSALASAFWTCVDMASGRYLWRHLVSSKPSCD